MHRSLFLFLIFAVSSNLQKPSAEVTFPGDAAFWSIFTDSSSNGNSRNIEFTISDSSVQWITELKPGVFQWPYTGLIRDIRAEQCRYNGGDTLIVEVQSTYDGKAEIQLCTFETGRTTADKPLSYRNLNHTIKITCGKNLLAIPLHTFKIASWWKTQNNLKSDDNRQFLDSICFIQLITNDAKRINHTDTLTVYNMSIKKKATSFSIFYFLIALCAVFASTIIIIVQRRFKRKATKAIRTDFVRLQPQQIATVPSDWQRSLSYLEKNYVSSDLTIQNMSRELGFSESKLSKLINENYPDGFRSLVHDLRITEGKRLLNESQMNIAEIAYKLGYSNVSHFNHEFKKKTEITPSAFRKQNHKNKL